MQELSILVAEMHGFEDVALDLFHRSSVFDFGAFRRDGYPFTHRTTDRRDLSPPGICSPPV